MVDRRAFLAATGGWLAATPLNAIQAEAVSPLWPGSPPGGGGPDGPERVDERGAVSNVARPSLAVVMPQRPNGAAMLIAAGGGYRRIEREKEARPAARWLAARGVTAYILTYRLPGEGWRDGPLAPLQDAQRALRLIRSRAAVDRIDPVRIGVLGFSAGAHLLGLAATRSAFASYRPADSVDALPARPAGAALIYPIITLEPPYDHTATRRVLVGRQPDPEASAAWSVETHVRGGCPPVFLVQTEDDPIADPAHARLMAEACRRAGVPVELHTVPRGGHGFGMGRPGTPTENWPGWYETWLAGEGLMTTSTRPGHG